MSFSQVTIIPNLLLSTPFTVSFLLLFLYIAIKADVYGFLCSVLFSLNIYSLLLYNIIHYLSSNRISASTTYYHPFKSVFRNISKQVLEICKLKNKSRFSNFILQIPSSPQKHSYPLIIHILVRKITIALT